jgi:hypothetical protein
MKVDNEKPPSITVCDSTPSGVRSGSDNRSPTWLGTLADVRHLSSPVLKFRLRHDLDVLGNFRQGN